MGLLFFYKNLHLYYKNNKKKRQQVKNLLALFYFRNENCFPSLLHPYCTFNPP